MTESNLNQFYCSLPGNIQTALKLLYECNIFPDRASASVQLSSDQGYSGHAISLAVGSAALYLICLFLSILS